MLTEICQYLRNWFIRDEDEDLLVDTFTISGGVLTDSDGNTLDLLEGQYYRIIGSVLNDGVHQFADSNDTLVDETFDGAVWFMAIPPVVISLVEEIEAWVSANSDAISSPYQSESFEGYSYSLKNGNSGTSAENGVTWQNQFKARLNPWRKI